MTDSVLRWVSGEGMPDDLAAFLTRHGRSFRNYHRRWHEDPSDMGGFAFSPKEVARAAYLERARYIKELGFSIPCREALDLLANHAPLVEIGAGTGLWSALLARRGVNVIATDVESSGERGAYGFVVGAHHPTEPLRGKTAVRRYRDRNVFCSWPTLGNTWFREAARAMRIGRTLIVVREDATAEDSAWNYIDRAFELTAELEIPCFNHIHDHIEVWLKKREVRRIAINAERSDD